MAWSDRRYDFEPTFRERAWQNGLFWLLGILVGVHVLVVILNGVRAVPTDFWLDWFAVSPAKLERGFIWQLFTYQFLHGGIGHLFWNCLILFLIGRILETLIGVRRTIGACLGCGAVAGLGVFLPGGGGPTVGISGGINALWVIAWCIAPNLPLNLIFFVVRLKWVAGTFLLLDVLRAFGGGVTTFGQSSGVAYQVHLVGSFAGFCYAWLWPRFLQPRLRDMQRRSARRKEVARFEQEMVEERELDRILAKINREGMQSLTERERRFLHKRSTKYQETKRP